MPEEHANGIGYREKPATVFNPQHPKKPPLWVIMQPHCAIVLFILFAIIHGGQEPH